MITRFLVIIAMLSTARAQTREVEREDHPDGTPRIERSVVVEQGGKLADGPYKRFHPGGQLAVEGQYTRGLPSGAWKSYYPDGSLRTEGEYAKGARYGKWRMLWPSGQLAATGRYSMGMRDGRWVYFDEQGAKLEAASGSFRSTFERYPDSLQETWLGEQRDDVFDGRFSSFWPNGVACFAGSCAHGVRDGWWSFRHADGTLESELLTGLYVGGVRTAGAREDRAPDPFAIEEEEREPPLVELSELPVVAAVEGLSPSQRNSIRTWVDSYLADVKEEDLTKAEMILVQRGREAVPHVVNALVRLDLSSADGLSDARRLVDGLLFPIAHDHGWHWPADGGEDEPGRQRLTVLRWYSWAVLAREDLGYWKWLAAAAPGEELLTLELLDHSHGVEVGVAAQGVALSGATPDWSESAFLEARRRVRVTSAVRHAIDDGLRWLVLHQSPDGAWYPGQFLGNCGKIGAGTCDGLGQSEHAPGVTGLCMLALLGSGEDPSADDGGGALLRAADWLLQKQDPTTGCFGERQGHSFVYNHAIAMLALCELYRARPTDVLREALERAVAFALSARNPGLGWRYDVPPQGKNDTSVTAWMAMALLAARDAGLDVPEEAFVGAVAWFDRVTDAKTGHVGYDAPASASARVANVNTDFPPDIGEPMTAAALCVRLALGDSLQRTPTLARYRDVVLAKPPVWDAEQPRTDLYYWLWASQALARIDSRSSEAWFDQMRDAALEHQRTTKGSDLAGSWDSIGPWAYAGGRLYSTAALLLALEAPIRAAQPKR